MALTLSEEAISRLPTDERESVFCEWFKVNFNNGALKVKHHEVINCTFDKMLCIKIR